MNRQFFFVCILFLSIAAPYSTFGQIKSLESYIQTKSDISQGGSSIFQLKDQTYLVSVASLAVNGKSESDCKKVGAAKAKKEMLSFVNGSEISSYTILSNSEIMEESLDEKKVTARQEYVEYIRETVIGTINQIVPLTGWYSEDKSVYYYAIYKIIEQ